VAPRRHGEADRILNRLQRENIRCLYHFTSIENLPCIRQTNALCSKETLEAEGLWPCPEPGGNELSHRLDQTNQNWDKVSLNFTPWTPMAYLKKQASHLCFFVVEVAVAGFEGVIFTDTNATSGDQHRAAGSREEVTSQRLHASGQERAPRPN